MHLTGLLQPSEHDHRNCNNKTKSSHQKNYPLPARETTSLVNLSQQRPQRGTSNGSCYNKNVEDKVCSNERETFIGNRCLVSSSSPTSSSAAEEMAARTSQGKRKEQQQQQQPVARCRTTTSAAASFSPNSNNTQPTKKSATSTTLAFSSTAAATETSASEAGNGGMSFLRNNFPFFRSSTSRSRSQSVISDVSRSSETGDSKKEKDKSYRRKSHLNRAFTDELVPDNNYMLDASPKSSVDVSSLECSAVEESRVSSKPAVKLHPAIPSVLTSNKSESTLTSNKSVNHSNSCSQNESIPTTNSHKSSPVVKKDSFSDAEGVSFIKKMLQKESDRDRAAAAAAESTGTKQNFQNCNSSMLNGNGSSGSYNVKKSPSAGNQSYWSKFSSSQSAFLRKLFEKPKVSESPVNLNKAGHQRSSATTNCTPSVENANGGKDSLEKENTEPVLGFSVAQKASFFMKLEHEQRFSKWRKNSVDLGAISSVTAPTTYSDQLGESLRLNTNGIKSVNEVRSKSRYLTRPVTPSEGIGAMVTPSSNGAVEGKHLEFGSLPRTWGTNFQSLENTIAENVNTEMNPSVIPKSSYTDYDDNDKRKFELKATTSNNKFNEISTTRGLEPISPYTIEHVKSYSLTRSGRHTGNADKSHPSNLGSFPMYHSASAITTAPSSCASRKHSNMKFCKNLGNAYSSSSSSFSESTKYLPSAIATIKNGIETCDPPTVFENIIDSSNNDKRRGSASDLELSGAANQSPLMSRSEKVKSMFISRNRYHCDTDNLSEDGEVSSGGQEVADIICRSYENSPVFRKKNWRAPKQAQSNFTKEIWRRCGNYESWNNSRTQPQQRQQQPQHPVPQTFTTTTNVIEVTTIPPSKLQSVAASPPPATSNLLQILTVLSSSNDELNEPKPKSKKQRQGGLEKVSGASSRADSIPPIHPHHNVIVQPRVNNITTKNPGSISSNYRHTMPPTPNVDTDEIFVSVPHPADDAFQSFFCSVKSYTQVSHYPPTNGIIATSVDARNDNSMQMQSHQGYASNAFGKNGAQIEGAKAADSLDISSVRRESDLLVMKKNVPICKRKSTGGKYKNPLRALAARMDFRQQGYTQTNSTNLNTVQCSSDVDVST